MFVRFTERLRVIGKFGDEAPTALIWIRAEAIVGISGEQHASLLMSNARYIDLQESAADVIAAIEKK